MTKPVSIRSQLDAHRLGIATVHQDLALADNLDVVANLFLGSELRTGGVGRMIPNLDEPEMEQRTRDLDEPTTALGVTETAEVLRLIRRLRSQGLGIVLVSHNLDTVFDAADRIVVLRLGRRVVTFDRSQSSRQEVVEAILGAAQKPAVAALAAFSTRCDPRRCRLRAPR